ncbi:MAG: 3-isopropylmalate dehydratase large subunit [Planctomycetota bacterium]
MNLIDRIWNSHIVADETDDTPAVLSIDGHLIHEVTSPAGFDMLARRGLPVRHPERTLATVDHCIPTSGVALPRMPPMPIVEQFVANCRAHGIHCRLPEGGEQGIVHVIGPELGFTQPGMTIVCGDSHTSTHGAFGALAFGIGSTEVGHVLATQCLLQRRPRSMRVVFRGRPGAGVTAKDLALAMIARIGVNGATGCVIEYAGEAVRAMDMESRMTLCNMSIEAGARAGMVAPDDVTFAWLRDRPLAPPRGEQWDRAVTSWRTLRSDNDATFDRAVTIDASTIEPMISWGTDPGMSIAITGNVPDPAAGTAEAAALAYMDLRPGPIEGQPIDVVFIGSCTNSRLGDLQAAADLMRGRRVADGVRVLVVPGSQRVKRDAEALGLHRVFVDAGAEWREPGCSMCIAMNGDQLRPGQVAVSTSNRNFRGRQGPGGRTLLASPLTAAAAAVRGCVTDPRVLMPGVVVGCAW